MKSMVCELKNLPPASWRYVLSKLRLVNIFHWHPIAYCFSNRSCLVISRLVEPNVGIYLMKKQLSSKNYIAINFRAKLKYIPFWFSKQEHPQRLVVKTALLMRRETRQNSLLHSPASMTVCLFSAFIYHFWTELSKWFTKEGEGPIKTDTLFFFSDNQICWRSRYVLNKGCWNPLGLHPHSFQSTLNTV